MLQPCSPTENKSYAFQKSVTIQCYLFFDGNVSMARHRVGLTFGNSEVRKWQAIHYLVGGFTPKPLLKGVVVYESFEITSGVIQTIR